MNPYTSTRHRSEDAAMIRTHLKFAAYLIASQLVVGAVRFGAVDT